MTSVQSIWFAPTDDTIGDSIGDTSFTRLLRHSLALIKTKNLECRLIICEIPHKFNFMCIHLHL